MTVKELIVELQKYNENATVIFTDDTYDSTYEEEYLNYDHVIGKKCCIYEAEYDDKTDKSIPSTKPNAMAISITDFKTCDY